MTQFVYKAKRGPYEVIEGELEASDEDQAVKTLDGLGLVPVQIESKKTIQGKIAPRVPRGGPTTYGVKRNEITPFVRNLANLIRGNVPILKALGLLAKQSKGGFATIATDLRDSVRDGLSLSQAMERHPKAFSPLLVAMVKGGESAGVLGEMLEKLADHAEKEEDLRRKVRGALVYPLFVLTMGAATVFALLTYFLPRLIGVYVGSQQELPWPTEIVLGVSHFLSSHWYWLLGILFIVAAVIRRMEESSEQLWWDGLKIQIPLIGDLILKSCWIHFSRTLGLLLGHGVPLVKAVPLAAATVDNHILGSQLRTLEEDLVKRGASLASALKKVPQCPAMMVDLVAIGEESGNLSSTLSHISSTYEKNLEELLKTFTTLLEPVLILAIGLVVGFIVFAMLMPIFQMDVFVD